MPKRQHALLAWAPTSHPVSSFVNDLLDPPIFPYPSRSLLFLLYVFPGEATRVASQERDQLIWDSDGFAQVLPKDKREVVAVLREKFGLVVGMTGT